MNPSAAIDAATIAKVAQLARLDLQPDERAAFQQDLQRILGYFVDLQAVATDDVAPMLHATGGPTPLRADETSPSLGSAAALVNAPESDAGRLVVPKVIG